MKIVFFGLGSIGKKHARIIKDKFKFDILAYRSNSKSKRNDLDIEETHDLDKVLEWEPDIAFITNPTSEHIKYATFCAKNGIDLFIEKPLSNNKDGVEELLHEIKKNNVKMYLAYCLRFHPAIVWLKNYLKENKAIHVTANVSSYLPDWRKEIDHLKNYSASKEMGGGVILDLSHEIDYLYYLFGNINNIKTNSKRISNVTVDSEDFLDVLLEFDNGIFGNLHMNFLSRLNRREIIIDFEKSTIVVDLIKNNILLKNGKEDKVINFNLERDDYLFSQLNYFFNNLKKRDMINSVDEALKIFDLIMEIKRGGK